MTNGPYWTTGSSIGSPLSSSSWAWESASICTRSPAFSNTTKSSRDAFVPAVVTVSEDGAAGGQFWTRIYGRSRGFPQVIHSSKRFAGPTGLEEYLGAGFGIALTVSADDQALHFHSDHYFFQAGRLRLSLPRWLSPGALTISHVDFGADWFAFVLVLEHPVLGEILSQTGLFRERANKE